MAYPYVPARYDYGPRQGPALGFVIHMAEGGGTARYLAGAPLRGVSVHYVIEYSGRIVRMLEEAHASGSINPEDLRTTDDADGFFGVTAAVAVLGGWARNPNAAVISVEIEGFAETGPNGDQIIGLQALVADVRSRHPAIGLLGHRDFADYKACPGRRIPWALIGGHGPKEDPMYELKIERWRRKSDGVQITTVGAPKWSDGTVDYTSRLAILSDADGTRRLESVARSSIDPVSGALDGAFYDALTHYALPSPDCTAPVAAEHERTRKAAIDAVTALP